MRLRWSIAAGLVVATFAVYFQVRHHVLLNYDDIAYLSVVRGDTGAVTLAQVMTRPLLDNWMPVTWLSWWLDHALYGEAPAGFLLGNVAYHALAAVLLFFALARMTGSLWQPAFVAAVFALHPLRVESVAWMSERKDVLSGCFFAATLLAYAGWVERRGAVRYGLVLAAAAAGMLSKPTLVTLPCVLLLLDWWPLRRLGEGWPDAARLRTALLEKLPLFALSAAVSAATIAVQRGRGYLADELVFPFGVRAANAIDATLFYVAKSVWPSGLAVLYPHPGAALPGWRVAAAAAVLLAFSGLALWAARRRPWWTVGWLWFVGMLVPMIGLVQVGSQAAADRYTYLPGIGLSLIVAYGAAEALRGRRGLQAAAAVVCLVGLGTAAHRQVAHWRDTTALFERAVAVTRDNALAHAHLGAAYERDGRADAALEQLERAVALRPDWLTARLRLADSLAGSSRCRDAASHYRWVLQRRPGHLRARVNFAQCLLEIGQFDAARAQLEAAAAEEGGLTAIYRVALHRGLARTAWEAGDPEAAAAHYRIALEVRPGDPAAHLGLAAAQLRLGRTGEAGSHAARALTGGIPGAAEAAVGLGVAAAAAGDPAGALGHFAAARELRADVAFAADQSAWILATAADPAVADPLAAIALMEAAAGAGRANALRLDALAAAYAAAGRLPEAVSTAESAALQAGGGALAAQIRQRLAGYRAGAAYRASPAAGPGA